MSAESNKALARPIYDAFAAHDYDRVLSLATEDIEVTLFPFGQTFYGHAGFREFMLGFTGAFPDITITRITNQVATEDHLVNEFIGHGTHTGPLMTPAGPVPPTGRPVEFIVCEVWELRDGKVAKLRNYQDAASLMRQLGLLPAPAAAPSGA